MSSTVLRCIRWLGQRDCITVWTMERVTVPTDFLKYPLQFLMHLLHLQKKTSQRRQGSKGGQMFCSKAKVSPKMYHHYVEVPEKEDPLVCWSMMTMVKSFISCIVLMDVHRASWTTHNWKSDSIFGFSFFGFTQMVFRENRSRENNGKEDSHTCRTLIPSADGPQL